jgi:hypothetical protein
MVTGGGRGCHFCCSHGYSTGLGILVLGIHYDLLAVLLLVVALGLWPFIPRISKLLLHRLVGDARSWIVESTIEGEQEYERNSSELRRSQVPRDPHPEATGVELSKVNVWSRGTLWSYILNVCGNSKFQLRRSVNLCQLTISPIKDYWILSELTTAPLFACFELIQQQSWKKINFWNLTN